MKYELYDNKERLINTINDLTSDDGFLFLNNTYFTFLSVKSV